MSGPLVVDLAAAGDLGAAQVGTKVARLLAARALGFATAPGFVITVAGVEHLDGWPAELAAAVEDHHARLGAPRVVVRTSAVDEDLAEASFAGQYESVLDVRGPAALRAAIDRCRASLAAPRVLAYREARGLAAAPRAAIAVVEQISGDVAGVAFSVDPVKGSADRVVIELGAENPSSVSDGRGRPVVVEFDKQAGRLLTGAPAAIAPEEAELVAQRVIALEAAHGHPVDVEWALVRGPRTFYVFQVRPVTALPAGPPRWDVGRYARRFADFGPRT